MGLKSFARAAVVATTVALTGVNLTAQPASADEVAVYWFDAAGAFDNEPGNGAEAWVWVWNGSHTVITLEYEFFDGSVGLLSTWGANSSRTAGLDRDVKRMRVCTTQYVCSLWQEWWMAG
ncbi:hypothetical protein ABGB18_46885 [Nonomuraea sp. B12E4]|uniref:hypothetical protein n=1 Tax=Nonomuraea sp. B12E4 TaxID=3153564 RepID=UPI00325C96C6